MPGQFPECVESLLIDAGYDTVLSLRNIDETKIKSMEDFLNTHRNFINKLKCCYSDCYKQQEVFAFLPGHKSVIMEIPDHLKVMEAAKLDRKRQGKRAKNTSEKTISKKIDGVSDMVLKKQLISVLMTSLMKCAETKEPGLRLPANTISESNIHDFKRDEDEKGFYCNCTFSCPFCSKKYSLRYRNYWMSSNATKHLKMHAQEEAQKPSQKLTSK